MQEHKAEHSWFFNTRILQLNHILYAGIIFWSLFVSSNALVRWLRTSLEFNSTEIWPVSVFLFINRDPQRLMRLVLATLVFAVTIAFIKHLIKKPAFVIIAAIIIALFSNLVQGFSHGFDYPITGNPVLEIQYYSDAINIYDPVDYFINYETYQPDAEVHTRVHPPIAVLFFYFLLLLFKEPWLIAIVITAVSFWMTLWFLMGIIQDETGGNSEFNNFTAVLFALLPAIQIYYCVSIDAIIAALFLGVIYFFLKKKTSTALVGAIACLFIASMFTFAVLYLVPVLLGYDLFRRKNLTRSIVIIMAVVVLLLGIKFAFHYNYLNSLQIAMKIENPEGHRLLYEPLSFFMTRIECVLEPIFFFGPIPWILMIRGLKAAREKNSNLYWISITGMIALIMIFLTGTYKNGETARSCMFIYPFLTFPIAVYLNDARPTRHEMIQIASWIFIHSLFLQWIGSWFW